MSNCVKILKCNHTLTQNEDFAIKILHLATQPFIHMAKSEWRIRKTCVKTSNVASSGFLKDLIKENAELKERLGLNSKNSSIPNSKKFYNIKKEYLSKSCCNILDQAERI